MIAIVFPPARSTNWKKGGHNPGLRVQVIVYRLANLPHVRMLVAPFMGNIPFIIITSFFVLGLARYKMCTYAAMTPAPRWFVPKRRPLRPHLLSWPHENSRGVLL
jgi:hypothetical protein